MFSFFGEERKHAKVGVEALELLESPLREDKYAGAPLSVDATRRCAAVLIKTQPSEAPLLREPGGEGASEALSLHLREFILTPSH